MTRRLRDLASARIATGLVGRAGELAVLLECLEEDGPRVLFVHGVGGIGKSSLLGAFAARARSAGAAVLEIDGCTTEPTERGFLGALGTVLGADVATVEDASERLAQAPLVVLIVDAAEHLHLLDAWLRGVLAPSLPEPARLVLASREPPVSAWGASPGWSWLFRAVALDVLGPPESTELLTRLGVPPDTAPRIAHLARGHPLALVLAASTLGEHPRLDAAEAAGPRVVEELMRLVLEDVQDPTTRRALEAASVVRRVSLANLGVLVSEAMPQDAYERLRALPFVAAGSDGLRIHEVVQHAVSEALRTADPPRHLALRRAAWRQLRSEVRSVGGRDLWRTTADALFLLENPVVREAFFPSGGSRYAVEPARPDDGAALRAIVARHESPEEARSIEEHWRRAPEGFFVARDPAGRVGGFYCRFEAELVPPGAAEVDPVFRAWIRHLQTDPLPRGQRALLVRRWLSLADGGAPGPVQAACWLDVKRSYMELRPQLRRVYLAVRELAPYAAVAKTLGIRPAPEVDADVDGRPMVTGLLDFGPGSVDGWLAQLIDAELGAGPGELLDVGAHELVLGARRVPLTPLELALMQVLQQREGRVVSRAVLLDEVWGATYDGASNVVDVMIRGLRRKLGAHAGWIETVRGVGYRLRTGPCGPEPALRRRTPPE
jgi:hypothetical protein